MGCLGVQGFHKVRKPCTNLQLTAAQPCKKNRAGGGEKSFLGCLRAALLPANTPNPDFKNTLSGSSRDDEEKGVFGGRSPPNTPYLSDNPGDSGGGKIPAWTKSEWGGIAKYIVQ
jgi:hypothetical protein